MAAGEDEWLVQESLTYFARDELSQGVEVAMKKS